MEEVSGKVIEHLAEMIARLPESPQDYTFQHPPQLHANTLNTLELR